MSIFRFHRLPRVTILIGALTMASANAAEFVYQGQLIDRNQPADGLFDVQLTPYLDSKLGANAAATITFPNVPVRQGQFLLEFELPLSGGEQAWVEVAVRDAGAGSFSAIPGRTKAISAALIGQCWSSTGDSGTNPTTNFLGTTDNQPLVFRTNNVQSLRIQPSAEVSGPLNQPITSNTIAGASLNAARASVRGATIAGGGVIANVDPSHASGGPNRVNSNYGTIGGGFGNTAGDQSTNPSAAPFATVDGGTNNTAIAESSTIGGGRFNTVTGASSTISGGSNSFASGVASTISGGQLNVASSAGSVVGGGAQNESRNFQSTVSGGFNNTASGSRSTVSGGFANTASGDLSTAAGGNDNCAGGQYSWAGGRSAKARPGSTSGNAGEACFEVPVAAAPSGDEGTFVWADAQALPFVSTGANQFLVRASGGFALNTAPYDANIEMTLNGRPGSTAAGNSDLALLPATGTDNEGILFSAINGGAGGNDVSLRIAHASPTQINERLRLDATGSVTIRSNITGANSGVTMAAGAGAWSVLSDRNVKTAVMPVDPIDVLDKLSTLPLARWQYVAQPQSVRHIGPMAQDFYAAFGVGENNTSISTIDADGVALAAIQGSNRKLQAEIAALHARLEALEAQLPTAAR